MRRLSPKSFFWLLLLGVAAAVLLQGLALEVFLRRVVVVDRYSQQLDVILTASPDHVRILAAGDSQPANDLDLERDDFLNVAYPSERMGETFIKLSYLFARGLRPEVVILPASHHVFSVARAGPPNDLYDPFLLEASAARLKETLAPFRQLDGIEKVFARLAGRRLPDLAADLPRERAKGSFWKEPSLLQLDPKYRGIAHRLLGLYLLGQLEVDVAVTPRGALLHPPRRDPRERVAYHGKRQVDPSTLGKEQQLLSPPYKYTEVLPYLAALYEKTIELCLDQGATVVLVRFPTMRAQLEHVSPEFATAVEAVLDGVLARYPDRQRLRYWNYLDLYADPADETLYHNREHLNEAGARLFSAVITRRLVEERLVTGTQADREQ